ncbi:hypothetical protein Tco_0834547 [Tanacetum coccineum]
MDDEEDDEVTKELYKYVNVNLGYQDANMTDAGQGGADQQNVSQELGFKHVEEDAHVKLTAVHDTQKTDGTMQSSSVSSNFTDKLLNFKNTSPADNVISSLMDTTVHHKETSSQASSLFTIPIMVIPEVTSSFTITIPLPPPFFNPLPQQATPTHTPTASKITTLFFALPDFLSVFKFNDRVTNLEKVLSEMNQVDQYAQTIFSIPAILDRYISNKLGEAIQKAIQLYNVDCIEEAQAEKREYFELIDTSKNVTKSLEAAVLEKSSSQPKSTYEAAASLLEFELMKILMDKIEESNIHVDDKDKDQDPSAGSDRGTKRRKSSKDVESSRDLKSKESKSSRSSKGTSRSQHNSSGKSAHAEEPCHTVNDSGVQPNQEFNTGNNDEQPDNKDTTKSDWYKKPNKPLTPDPITERLDWHNPEGKKYLFDLYKPLSLILDHQGRQVIPKDYFINNDLEYLKGGSLSRQYSTSITKIKAATYEVKWIEDTVPNL